MAGVVIILHLKPSLTSFGRRAEWSRWAWVRITIFIFLGLKGKGS